MRTTVRIDDDLLRELKSRAVRNDISLARLFNQVLRRGLAAERAPLGKSRRPYRQKTVAMGAPRVVPGFGQSPDKALALAAAMEDDEIIEKLARGK